MVECLDKQRLGCIDGLFVLLKDASDRVVVDHIGQAVATEKEAITVAQAKPADIGFDLAVMAAQEIGEHMSFAVVAHFLGSDIARVGHRLGDGVVLGQELESPSRNR